MMERSHQRLIHLMMISELVFGVSVYQLGMCFLYYVNLCTHFEFW